MPQKSFARKQFVLNLLGALAVIWAPHVLAVYDASTNTETLTDLMISRTRSDTAKGDMVDYIHPDRDLTITWTGPKRSDDFETPIKRPAAMRFAMVMSMCEISRLTPTSLKTTATRSK